jgi:hypothetical protein
MTRTTNFILAVCLCCSSLLSGHAQTRRAQTTARKPTAFRVSQGKADAQTVAKVMVSTLNFYRYPRETGTKYGMNYLVALAGGRGTSDPATAFRRTLQLPDEVVAPIVDADEKEPFKTDWPREMNRLKLDGDKLPMSVATALMKDFNARQNDYLARAKVLTPELISEWNVASQFSGGNLSRVTLAMLMIQHEPLFRTGSLQVAVAQNELKKLLSIPLDSASSWASTVSSHYDPVDAAFALLAVPELFTGNTFNRPLFEQALPIATKLMVEAR